MHVIHVMCMRLANMKTHPSVQCSEGLGGQEMLLMENVMQHSAATFASAFQLQGASPS